MTPLTRNFRVTALTAVAALSLLLTAAAPAFAAEGTPPAGATPAPNQAARDARLARQFKTARDLLQVQADNLAAVPDIAAQAQAAIDQAKTKGKDTSALESALAAAKGLAAQAQTAHDKAQALAAAHAGFDAAGQVTDAAQAKTTLQGINQAMTDARRLLRQAETDLRRALREFRQANRPVKPEATATPKP